MPTWMVVEDEPDLYDTLLMFFEIWGVDGIAFTTGTDAIRWIEDIDRGANDTDIPELALLDIRLPGAEGPEIGERLRQSPVLQSMAVVLTTAYHLSPQEEQAAIAQAQADAIIYKPLPKPSELRVMLEQAIELRRNRPAGAAQPLRAGRVPAPTAPRIGHEHAVPSRLARSTPGPTPEPAPRARRLARPELPPREPVPQRSKRSIWGWIAAGLRRLFGRD